MSILVTGGAGYIGSVVVEELLKRGESVVVYDSLYQGHRAAVDPGAIFIKADLADTNKLDETIQQFEIKSVMHFAAETVVERSMSDPARYFQNNVVLSFNLLEAMRRQGVKKIVFSSSAAVYGEPVSIPIKENDPKSPTNSYGESKLMTERMLRWYDTAYGIRYASLRYFNAAGASEKYGEDHNPESHLIPLVLQTALGKRDRIEVFGTDYQDTPDGSCIRDYIHVTDLAQAHILALDALEQESCVYNLGNGAGYSVLQVIEKAKQVTGREINVVYGKRRPGDPARLVASSDLIRRELGWEPKYPELETMIETAWQWYLKHPNGYED
ncbi:MAG: UDP-glucose 4-epimerase GalE [Candidatus Latescibacterota bacterium]|nr:MAG: UDP-glucose 4-epimerase GalE [Candidatus Latescibacterota bacterium]RKY74150.1 MAG: UDP-glucose 4-epimerase GalE [Candidatus Latescibacterota bacterium]HDN67753.1 UDP-glucose 4-epimerase GalE [Bacillota bacterium]